MASNPQLQTTSFSVPVQPFMDKYSTSSTVPSSHELVLLKKEVLKKIEHLKGITSIVNANKAELVRWLAANGGSSTPDLKIKLKVQDKGSSLKSDDVSGGAQTPEPRTIMTKSGNQIKMELKDSGMIKIQKGKQNEKPDYSKVKIQQAQIPFTTFQSYCDQFFRPLTFEDLESLQEKEGDISAFLIPKTGVHYKELFKKDDLKLARLIQSGLPASNISMKEYYEVDGTVYDGDLSIGSLSSRLLGAFVREGVVPSIDGDEGDNLPTLKRSSNDLALFEDRLREELCNIGLLERKPDRDSEIRSLLVAAQSELREVIAVNNKRRKKLRKIAEFHMGYQEYLQLLGEVNKAVENCYIKKFKTKPVKAGVARKKVILASRDVIMY
jgi:hypothetical protein